MSPRLGLDGNEREVGGRYRLRGCATPAALSWRLTGLRSSREDVAK